MTPEEKAAVGEFLVQQQKRHREMVRQEQEHEAWLAEHHEEGLRLLAEEERAAKEQSAAIDLAVSEATQSGFADASAVAAICRMAERPEWAFDFIAERLPLREVSRLITDRRAEESAKVHICSKYPEVAFLPPSSDKPTIDVERCREIIYAGLMQHAPQRNIKRISTPAHLMMLKPCVSKEQLQEVGVNVWVDAWEAVRRLAVMIFHGIREYTKRAALKETLEETGATAAELTTAILGSASARRMWVPMAVWDAGRNAVSFAARCRSSYESVLAAIRPLRKAAEGQRWVLEGVYDRTTSGHPEVRLQLVYWGVDLTATALTGEQRHQVLKEYLAQKNPDDVDSVIERAFLLGLVDAETREPYFRERDLADLPIVDVSEIGCVVLWLSGLLPEKPHWPRYWYPLPQAGRGKADYSEIPYLLRATRVDAGHGEDKEVTHQLAAVNLLKRGWLGAKGSVFGYVGKSITNEQADYYNEKTEEGRLLYYDDRPIGKGNSGLDTAFRKYGKPRRATKKPKVDKEDFGRSVKLHNDAFLTPIERLRDADACFSEDAARFDIPTTSEDIRAHLRYIDDQLEVGPLAPEKRRELSTQKEDLLRELRKLAPEHSETRKCTPGAQWPAIVAESVALEHFDAAVMKNMEIDRAFHDVYGGNKAERPPKTAAEDLGRLATQRAPQSVEYAPVFRARIKPLPCAIVKSAEHCLYLYWEGQRERRRFPDPVKSPFPFPVGARVEHRHLGAGTVDGVYNTDGTNRDPTVVIRFDLAGRRQYHMSEVLTDLTGEATFAVNGPIVQDHQCSTVTLNTGDWREDGNPLLVCDSRRWIKDGDAERSLEPFPPPGGAPNDKFQRFLLELWRKRTGMSYLGLMRQLAHYLKRIDCDLTELTSGETEPLVSSLRSKKPRTVKRRKDAKNDSAIVVRRAIRPEGTAPIYVGDNLDTKCRFWPQCAGGNSRRYMADSGPSIRPTIECMADPRNGRPDKCAAPLDTLASGVIWPLRSQGTKTFVSHGLQFFGEDDRFDRSDVDAPFWRAQMAALRAETRSVGLTFADDPKHWWPDFMRLLNARLARRNQKE